jgi:hypothetical protein
MPPDSIKVADVQSPTELMFPSDTEENVIRNVDWYSFTDESGDQWLVEGLRESIVRPAVYEEGL